MKIKLKKSNKMGDGQCRTITKEVEVIKEYEEFYLVQHPERI